MSNMNVNGSSSTHLPPTKLDRDVSKEIFKNFSLNQNQKKPCMVLTNKQFFILYKTEKRFLSEVNATLSAGPGPDALEATCWLTTQDQRGLLHRTITVNSNVPKIIEYLVPKFPILKSESVEEISETTLLSDREKIFLLMKYAVKIDEEPHPSLEDSRKALKELLKKPENIPQYIDAITCIVCQKSKNTENFLFDLMKDIRRKEYYKNEINYFSDIQKDLDSERSATYLIEEINKELKHSSQERLFSLVSMSSFLSNFMQDSDIYSMPDDSYKRNYYESEQSIKVYLCLKSKFFQILKKIGLSHFIFLVKDYHLFLGENFKCGKMILNEEKFFYGKGSIECQGATKEGFYENGAWRALFTLGSRYFMKKELNLSEYEKLFFNESIGINSMLCDNLLSYLHNPIIARKFSDVYLYDRALVRTIREKLTSLLRDNPGASEFFKKGVKLTIITTLETMYDNYDPCSDECFGDSFSYTYNEFLQQESKSKADDHPLTKLCQDSQIPDSKIVSFFKITYDSLRSLDHPVFLYLVKLLKTHASNETQSYVETCLLKENVDLNKVLLEDL